MSLPSAFYTSSEIYEREVEFPDGTKYTLHFCEVSAVDFRKFQIAEASEYEDVRALAIAKLIAACVVEADGSPKTTLKDAIKINRSGAEALLNVILDVNGFGKSKNG